MVVSAQALHSRPMHSMENRSRVKGPLRRAQPALDPSNFGEPRTLGHLTRSIHINVVSCKFVSLIGFAASSDEVMLEETFGFAQTVVSEDHRLSTSDVISPEVSK